jgi:hypothetical protein
VGRKQFHPTDAMKSRSPIQWEYPRTSHASLHHRGTAFKRTLCRPNADFHRYSSPHTNLYEATSIKASATAKITGDVDGGVIECKLCSTVELSSWQCFRRHCDTSEDHPVKLTFCNRCGNYFGRQDSKRRHKRTRKYQEEWRTTPRE